MEGPATILTRNKATSQTGETNSVRNLGKFHRQVIGPGRIRANENSEVTVGSNNLKLLPMKGVGDVWWSLNTVSVNSKHFTFGWVESHFISGCPISQIVYSLLQG